MVLCFLARWTRVLLLQQLLVDAIDLLDPDYVRVPKCRRVRLMPEYYAPLPNVSMDMWALWGGDPLKPAKCL
jgi:hypothetical protein